MVLTHFLERFGRPGELSSASSLSELVGDRQLRVGATVY